MFGEQSSKEEAKRIKDLAYRFKAGVMLEALFRTKAGSDTKLCYLTPTDIPLSIKRWGTEYFLVSVQKYTPEFLEE